MRNFSYIILYNKLERLPGNRETYSQSRYTWERVVISKPNPIYIQ